MDRGVRRYFGRCSAPSITIGTASAPTSRGPRKAAAGRAIVSRNEGRRVMDQPATPTVLLSDPMLAGFAPALEGEGWRVAHAWDLAEADRGRVGAIVHAGDIVLPRAN